MSQSSPQQRPPSPNPVGLWFCQISSGLQLPGRWPSGRAEMQGAKNGAGGKEQPKEESKAAGNRDAPRRTRTTCSREAMTEATVCLLLDRFAPT
uniref:Uncharacterized protein n=1 Tax=Arundo donax TaxID=35708 RepID=A0A0A8Y9Z5_ARUDO